MSSLTIEQIEKESDILNFQCGVKSIDDQVKDSFFKHILHKKKVFKICFQGTPIGFYQISFGHIILTDTKVPYNDYDNGDGKFGVLWIDFLAIREELQRRGIGKTVLITILKDAEILYQNWPIRVIIIDALADKTEWYLNMGFDFIKEKDDCTAYGTLRMFYDLMPERDKLQISEYCAEYYQ